MKKTYLVVYEKGKKNHSGFAPDVAGCRSMGKTLEGMRANLRETLELYMQTSAEFGYALPEPKIQTVTLPIEGETDSNTTYVVEHLTISFPRPAKTRTRVTRTTSMSKRRTMQAA